MERVHARAHVSLSSKSAQLTPQWVKSGFLREQYPVSAPSSARMLGFFVCLFVPEGVTVSGTQQATSSHLDKRTGETLMLAIWELVRIRKTCCTRQNIKPEIKQACTEDAYLPPRQRNQKKKKKRGKSSNPRQFWGHRHVTTAASQAQPPH